MPRRHQTFQRREPSAKDWSGIVPTIYTVVAAGTKVLLGSFTLSNSGIDETILRTVGLISVKSDQVAGSESQIGSFGMIVVSTNALTAGAASIPGPVTDIGNDGWFLYRSFINDVVVFDGTGVQSSYDQKYEFNSKGKRIIQSGQAVAVMVENAHATTGLSIAVTIRMLSMRHGR